MKRLVKKAVTAVRNPKRVAKLVAKQGYVLVKFGPVEYGHYLKRAVSRHMFIHNFPNGIKTSLDEKKAHNWHLLNKKSLVIVLVGEASKDISDWAAATEREARCHFMVSERLGKKLDKLKSTQYTALAALSADKFDLVQVKSDIQRTHRGNDVLFLDASLPLPRPFDVIRLQHAAYSYDEDREIGFVLPAYRAADGEIVAGFEFDRARQAWVAASKVDGEYDQRSIPRYTLTGTLHGLYVTASAIQRVSLLRSDVEGATQDEQVARYVANGWKQNVRTLVFSPVVLEVKKIMTPKLATYQKEWLNKRIVTNANGDKKVIYVLNATSVSGGIRVIFEHANGLVKRGFDVEIWSLQGQPTWTDLDITVKKFRTYSDLYLALRNEEAIKVATWWETAQVVWLASVNAGIPVNFIQEFETWFYPNDPIARAAVVSSYRREFAYMTTADFQQAELREIGVEAPIIPVGYEETYYYQDKSIERESDVVLALGRSFFQKNFAMTARAWKSLKEKRPRMYLFGSEPDVLKDEKVTYHVRPSNEEVNVLYNTATCFIQTSLHEGFSLPIIEAMAAGCPVITTDSHGNRGFCFDGKNCLIVPQNDDAALAKSIERLISDTALQNKLRAAGLKTAQQYRWSVILDDLASFYQAVK